MACELTGVDCVEEATIRADSPAWEGKAAVARNNGQAQQRAGTGSDTARQVSYKQQAGATKNSRPKRVTSNKYMLRTCTPYKYSVHCTRKEH